MKNLKLKNLIKITVSPVITFFNKILPKNETKVLLYIPNKRFIYSLGPLRQYLVENKFNEKYQISYGYLDMEKYGEGQIVKFLSFLKCIITFFNAKYVFYTCGQLPIKPSNKQIVIHVQHGIGFKPLGKLSNIDNGDEYFFTYMIAMSELYVPILAKEYECPEECIRIAGDPMADALLRAPKYKYDLSSYSKILVWTPTFRNSELMGYHDSDLDTLVPLFDFNDYLYLNNILENYNIKLIVKLHPIQTVPDNLQRHFSHLSVYSHDEFIKSGYDMYTLIANSDGLIGDYSSISMQYLLTDKPQAYVVPDIEDYANNRGFVFDNPEDYMGGHIIKTKEQFYKFIQDFAVGNDVYAEKRRRICKEIFKYQDANSCERIINLSGMSI